MRRLAPRAEWAAGDTAEEAAVPEVMDVGSASERGRGGGGGGPRGALDVPGPVGLPVIGNALDVVGVALSELMLRYASEFGPFLKFSILKDTLYLMSEPESILYVNNTNSRNYLDRWTPPGFEDLLYNGQLRGLVFSQGRYWMQHRQIVGSVFPSNEFLTHYIDTVTKKTTFMMDELWAKDKGAMRNVHQEMRMLTLDIIGSAAFGAE